MKRILLIEDNPTNVYLTRFILEAHGHGVIVANDGTTGVALALSERPDLIIMDIQLPDINGLEATKQIRASEIGDSIPIVAMTSYAMTRDRRKALAVGCTGHMQKPINPDTFVSEIEQYLIDRN